MIPMANLAPLDYQYALDAASSLLAPYAAPRVICHAPELWGDVRQRFPEFAACDVAALWVEPQREGWRADLSFLASTVAKDAPLVVVASRPSARLLPERRLWVGRPLGMRPGGVTNLSLALHAEGFTLERRHGVHSWRSVALGLAGRITAIAGRRDIADRLRFAAQRCYRVDGRFAACAAVALLEARRR